MFSKPNSRKANKKAGTQSATTAGQPFFDDVNVTLAYSVQVSAAATANSYSYAVCMNDVFDPDATASAVQPLGYDPWSTIYGRWTVMSSTAEVTCISRTSGAAAQAALVPTPNTSSATTYAAAAAMKFAVHGSFQQNSRPLRLRKKITSAEIFGVPQATIVGDLNYSGIVNASPALRALWTVVLSTTGATDAFSLDIMVKYKVRFWFPNVIVLSATRRLTPAQLPASGDAHTTPSRQSEGPRKCKCEFCETLRSSHCVSTPP